MEWDKALAELLLEEPEIRSWLGVDPRANDREPLRLADPPPPRAVRKLEPAVAA